MKSWVAPPAPSLQLQTDSPGPGATPLHRSATVAPLQSLQPGEVEVTEPKRLCFFGLESIGGAWLRAPLDPRPNFPALAVARRLLSGRTL